MLDIEIARRGGLAKPTNVRATIRNAIASGLLSADDVRTLSVPREIGGKNGGHRSVTEYWLTETGSLLILTQMKTPFAIASTRTMVKGFREAARLLREPAPAPVLPAATTAAEWMQRLPPATRRRWHRAMVVPRLQGQAGQRREAPQEDALMWD